MTKTVFVTGSASGIGRATAEMLLQRGHRVVFHARDERRAADLGTDSPTVVGDLSSLDETRRMAYEVSTLGPLDAVIHNAGVYEAGARVETVDGLERTFQVNVLAPYLLTALIPIPARLIYLTSGMASGGRVVLDDLQRQRRSWSATGAYQDSKLCDIALTLAVCRRHADIAVTAVCPGWVRSRMGGPGAPTDLDTGSATQVWLATSDEPAALANGRFMRHMRELDIPHGAGDFAIQDGLLRACAQLTGTGALTDGVSVCTRRVCGPPRAHPCLARSDQKARFGTTTARPSTSPALRAR